MTYTSLHTKIRKLWGQAKHCEACGANKVPFGQKRYFEWSNKDNKYSGKRKDWQQLCQPCHRRYDRLHFPYEPWNKGQRKQRPELICSWCGKTFIQKRSKQLFCSVKCVSKRNGDIRKRKAREQTNLILWKNTTK